MVRILIALGWTEEVTACDCCSKSNLTGTVALECQETGEIVYYGSSCAIRHTGRKGLASEAAKRREDLRRQFDVRRQALPEVKAYEAKIAEGHRAGVNPGKEFRLFLGCLPNAVREVEDRLRAELGLDEAWKRRAA